jgi:hypothetical protein
MVSVEAASLLAQVLPVGVFVLILESRRAVNFFEAKGRAGSVVLGAYWLFFFLASFSGLSATKDAVTAVVTDTAMRGGEADFFLFSSNFLYFAVAGFAALIAFNESGFALVLFDMGGRSRQRTDARRAARQGRHEK